MNAALALRKAIFARLSADAPLRALIGPGSVFDEVPRGQEPPYLTLGEGNVKDWSTSSDRGHEHHLVITAWSKQGGVAEVLSIAAAAVATLEAMPAALEGHRLVNLVGLGTEVKREADRRLVKAGLRLRAVTEAVAP
jgi:hypothetical protein